MASFGGRCQVSGFRCQIRARLFDADRLVVRAQYLLGDVVALFRRAAEVQARRTLGEVDVDVPFRAGIGVNLEDQRLTFGGKAAFYAQPLPSLTAS